MSEINAAGMKKAKIEYITAVLLYGTIGLLVQFINAESEFIVLCRGIIGTATILIFMTARKQRVDLEGIRRNFMLLTLSGVCLGLNWIFLFIAYQITTIAVASLCNYMAPIIVIALSPLVLKEKLTLKKSLCVAVAFAGIVLVSELLEGDIRDVNLPGIAMGLLAAAAFVGIVLCNKKIGKIEPMSKSAYQLLVSAAVVLPYVLIKNGGIPFVTEARSIILILILGIVQTGIAYIFYFGGMGVLPVQSVAILGYLEPVVTVLTGVVILRQHISHFGILGAVLILGAAVYSEIELPRRKKTEN
ncbi:MAG: EamA family transporter [Clostridiales bacterium]|nr:EamA family transporter [Clostridiales bacterium]